MFPLVALALAQEPAPPEAPAEDADGPVAAGPVTVEPTVTDLALERRLTEVLTATKGYDPLTVEVRAGVATIRGEAQDRRYRDLAAELARNTEGVAAVLNDLDLDGTAAWSLDPARQELRDVAREVIRALPTTLLGVLLASAGVFAARAVTAMSRPALQRRVTQPLLREVAARALGLMALLLASYLALRILGLTRLAITLIGGTGLVGLVVGIAFRGITENFLASLFLSAQQPFREGDLVRIGDALGYVQRLTSRSTVLMTLDGTQVQVPNATVFSSVLHNHSSTRERRESFIVGIGYQDAVPHAQDLALQVLREHPAVLSDPEPWVLVDALGPATVDLKVYFWLDGTTHSWLKVRSSVIRLVKRAFQEAGISLPDEAREVVFPQDVPIRVTYDAPAPGATRIVEPAPTTTASEGDLASEARTIGEQGRRAWMPQGDENLLGRPR